MSPNFNTGSLVWNPYEAPASAGPSFHQYPEFPVSRNGAANPATFHRIAPDANEPSAQYSNRLTNP